MSQFLNKDYSEVLKKTDRKTKSKTWKIIMGLKEDLIEAKAQAALASGANPDDIDNIGRFGN